MIILTVILWYTAFFFLFPFFFQPVGIKLQFLMALLCTHKEIPIF